MSDPYDPEQMPRHIPRHETTSPPLRRYGDELIIRIDERTQQLATEMKGLKEVVVSRAEFAPVRMLVFGLVGLLLIILISAMAATVIVK